MKQNIARSAQKKSTNKITKKKFKPKTERKMFIYQIADKERTLNQSN